MLQPLDSIKVHVLKTLPNTEGTENVSLPGSGEKIQKVAEEARREEWGDLEETDRRD